MNREMILFVLILVIIIIRYAVELVAFSKIPRLTSLSARDGMIIYRTSRSRHTNLKVYNNCYRKWMELNPSATMIWFDDLDCKRYMSKQPRKI